MHAPSLFIPKLVSSLVSLPAIADSDSTFDKWSSSPPLSVINIESGKCYRFQLVSISWDTYFKFSIDGHMVEAAINTQPLTVDPIKIHTGQ
jgi:Multicopper oxidase